jgi:hypothetical protein
MQNFANQCLDMARAILEHNLNAIHVDGTVAPVDGEESLPFEPGHVVIAIGEYYRATQETKLGKCNLVELAARCITAQAKIEEGIENGLAYASLGLLSFGPSKDRNLVWELLDEETQKNLDKHLLARSDYKNHYQAFNIARAVARFSMGLSKKDETGKLIDRFLERINENSTGGYFDNDNAEEGKLDGIFDLYGVLCFIFIRQALQLHGNMQLRERKLPSLRTFAEKYIKLIPDLVRHDGLGWAYGKGIGAYGQMHCISLILQAIRDGWVNEDQKTLYYDVLRRLFHYFFVTYLDQEHGFLVIRDNERSTSQSHTTRLANFDAVRYLCQWARLAKPLNISLNEVKPLPTKTKGRFITFDKSSKKEQGLFVYHDSKSGMLLQLPLCASGTSPNSDYLAFPHCPGIFDWPSNKYLPIMLPELTFGDKTIVPAYYGKRITTSLGLKNSYILTYEQPDLISVDEKIIPDLGSCKVVWTFADDKITSDFTFTVKQVTELTKMRYMIALSAPHSQYRIGTTFTLGEESVRAQVIKDDFQANWLDTEVVTDDLDYRTYYGKIHYLQTLMRDHPLTMRPGHQYRLVVSFQPDIAMADE